MRMLWLAAASMSLAATPGERGALPPEAELVGVGTPAVIPGLPPGPPPAAETIKPLAHQIGAKLRCPVCQGLSIADSQSEAAVMIQNRITELVAAGYTEDQITDYFIDRYGEWILLAPRAEGLNWLVWLGPGVAGGLGLAWAAMTVATWRKEPDDVPLPSDQGLVEKDPFEARLLEELDE